MQALFLCACVCDEPKLQTWQQQEHDLRLNPITEKGSIAKQVRAQQTTTHHDGLGGVAVAGVDEVGDGIALHPDDALGDDLARVLGGDHEHDVPGMDPPDRGADPVHRQHVARQVNRRHHAGAPTEGEREEVLVDEVDGAVGLRHQERAGEGVPRYAPPRDAPEAPEEARHVGGGGGGGEERGGELGRRSEKLLGAYLSWANTIFWAQGL